jgi:hypothetical protein
MNLKTITLDTIRQPFYAYSLQYKGDCGRSQNMAD